MRRVLTDAQEFLVGQRYLSGETTYQLRKPFNASLTVIINALKRRGIKRRSPIEAVRHRRAFTLTQERKIIQSYLAGKSTPKLAALYKTSQKAIMNVLRRNKIPRRPRGARRYKCNDSFFDRIDSEAKAYWLGFIAADGSIVRNCICINLQRRDRAHLKKFLNSIAATYRIYDWYRKGHWSSAIVISSTAMREALAGYGIVSGKTLTIRWPDLPTNLLRHFLRGYVDGDGHWRILPERNQFAFRLWANKSFLQACQKYLMARCHISKTQLHRMTHCSIPLFELACTGRYQVPRVAKLLYKNATVFLSRKHVLITSLLD